MAFSTDVDPSMRGLQPFNAWGSSLVAPPTRDLIGSLLDGSSFPSRLSRFLASRVFAVPLRCAATSTMNPSSRGNPLALAPQFEALFN
jgi:hypothetical protein